MNTKALVIHPLFAPLGGGEYVCLNVMKALLEVGIDVTLMSHDYSGDVSEAFGIRDAPKLEAVLSLPPDFKPFLPRGLAAQRAFYARRVRQRMKKLYRDYDIIFHTQTSYFLGPPMRRCVNIFYDPSDIKLIDPVESPWKNPYYRLVRAAFHNKNSIRDAYNIPLARDLEEHLEKQRYRHSSYVFPPCNMQYYPAEKQKRVIQTTRVVPHKRLEDFMEIARRLPDYPFLLVGSISKLENELYPGYVEKLLSKRPPNVSYIEKRLSKDPSLLTESQVYLYTAEEPGINISTAQAVGAGCIPVTPIWGGGAEIVNEIMQGYRYETIDQAVEYVHEALTCPRWSPESLRRAATIFSDERFRWNIQGMLRDFVL